MTGRRQALKALGALGLSALPRSAWPDHPAKSAATPSTEFCGSGEQGSPLFIPGTSGLFGRLSPRGTPIVMRASATAGVWPLAYGVEFGGQRYANPTLVLEPGERVRIELDNALTEPTIVHWHGLTIDTRNDGAGLTVVKAAEKYAYDFEVRDRGGLYWYHPHPHGLTAAQAYRGLFGLVEIEDADERALRAALDLVPGQSEIPLILQDRLSAGDYEASPMQQMHGFLGDTVRINGTACPHLDVTTRMYRFRVLNASNARNYRLAFTASEKIVPFTLVGTDDGLLRAPRPCAEAFLSPAERIDLLLDLSGAAPGDSVYLETRSFDPMHMEMGAMSGESGAAANASMDHGGMAMDHATMNHGAMDHTAMEHGGGFPEGAPRALLELRVRKRVAYAARIPATLCKLAPIDVASATERPLRLGFAKGRWRINDRVYAMGETPIEVRRGSVETWLIRNYFNSMPHAMHLHGFHFDVLERQTSPDQIAALKVDAQGRLATDTGRKDTVLVWPGETVRITFDFSLPASPAFAGDQLYVFHCHNLEHEDGGMMLGVRVT
jgi:blue copper oxidase